MALYIPDMNDFIQYIKNIGFNQPKIAGRLHKKYIDYWYDAENKYSKYGEISLKKELSKTKVDYLESKFKKKYKGEYTEEIKTIILQLTKEKAKFNVLKKLLKIE